MPEREEFLQPRPGLFRLGGFPQQLGRLGRNEACPRQHPCKPGLEIGRSANQFAPFRALVEEIELRGEHDVRKAYLVAREVGLCAEQPIQFGKTPRIST